MQDNDLISRAALLAAYDAAHKGPPGGARKLIEEAPGVGGWISVNDRMPELTRQVESDDFLIDYSEYVVVLSEGRNHFPKIGRYAREGLRERWEDKDYDPIPDVTHWMLLPEKPKGDNNATD